MELHRQSIAATTGQPGARRTIFAAFRTAALELWGPEGLKQIGERMPADARRDTVDVVVIASDYLPEEYVHAWYEAAFNGPAARQNREYFRFLDKMMDHGFGRVRKLLLGLVASPHDLGPKVALLWRHDHTHGTLVYTKTGPTSQLYTLRDHAYLATPLSRASIAEIFRYAAALCRAKDVVSSHSLEDGALVVRISWR